MAFTFAPDLLVLPVAHSDAATHVANHSWGNGTTHNLLVPLRTDVLGTQTEDGVILPRGNYFFSFRVLGYSTASVLYCRFTIAGTNAQTVLYDVLTQNTTFRAQGTFYVDGVTDVANLFLQNLNNGVQSTVSGLLVRLDDKPVATSGLPL